MLCSKKMERVLMCLYEIRRHADTRWELDHPVRRLPFETFYYCFLLSYKRTSGTGGGRRGEGEGRGGKGLSAAGSRNAATARDRIRAPLSRSRNAHIAGLACSQTDQRRRTCNRGGLRPTPGVHNNNNDNSRVKFNLLASRDA